MLLPVILLLAQDAGVEAALREYHEKIRADVPCSRTADENEIVVCARRDADRYRVPLVTNSAGREDAGERMKTLLSPDAAGKVACGKGAFTSQCGAVSIGVTMGGEGGARVVERPLAP